jgi:short chain dehydrogenase
MPRPPPDTTSRKRRRDRLSANTPRRDAGRRCWEEVAHDFSRPFAVVTGASSGIARELAREFATNGFDLLIAAEDDAIATTAAELQAGDARVEHLQVDPASDDGVDALYDRIKSAGRAVDAIALNAASASAADSPTASSAPRRRTSCGSSISTSAPRCISPST